MNLVGIVSIILTSPLRGGGEGVVQGGHHAHQGAAQPQENTEESAIINFEEYEK